MKLTTYLDKFGLLDRVERVAGAEWSALCRWNFTINHHAKSRFGCCKLSKKLVEVTSEYYIDGIVKEDEYDDLISTLLHETAHAIVHERYGFHNEFFGNIKSHGHEWKYVMHALGVDPKNIRSTGKSKILKDAKVTKRKAPRPYIYTCKDCGYQFKRTRAMKNWQRSWHRGCRHKANRGALVFTLLS